MRVLSSKAIANANNLHLKVTTGPHAKIAYFTGKTQIFEADTVLGKVSASHSPRIKFGGPKGAGFKNSIFVTIAYDAPVLFAESIDGISTLLRFFEMLVGRPQNILNVSVQLAPDQHNLPVLLDVYWNLGPKRAQSNTSRKTGFVRRVVRRE